MRSLIFIFLFLLSNLAATGQSVLFKTYDRFSGLPSDYIFTAYQDRQGFMWFCTDRGISRYDGHEFLNFGAAEGLKDLLVYSVFEDSKGNFWVNTYEGGLYRFDGKRFQKLRLPGTDSINNMLFTAEDRKGHLYFIGNWFYVSTGGKLQRSQYPSSIPLNSPVTALKDSGILINYKSSPNYLVLFPGKNGEALSRELFHSKVPLIASKQGLAEKVLLNGEVFWLLNDTIYEGSPYFRKEQSYEDYVYARGVYYTATRDGIRIQEGQRKEEIRVGQGLSNNYVQDVFIDREGNCWLSTLGGGVQRITSRYLQLFDGRQGLLSENITRGYIWGDKGVLIGGENGLYLVNKDKLNPIRPDILKNVRAFYARKNGDLLIGTYEGLFRFPGGDIRKKPVLELGGPRSGISAIQEQPEGTIWLGTYGDGLLRCDSNLRITKVYGVKEGLRSSQIENVYFRHDTMLLNFTEGSIAMLNDSVVPGFMSKQELYGHRPGFYGNTVVAYFSYKGRRYVLSDKCLHLQHGNALQAIRSYRIFPKENTSVNSVAVDSARGYMYLSTTRGFIAVSLERAVPNLIPTATVLLELSTDSIKNINTTLPIELPSDTRSVLLRYAALSYICEEENRFLVVLQGDDYTRSIITKEPSQLIENLPYGQYRLRIVAISPDGVYSSQPVQLSFVIRTPFYLQIWFLLLSTMALLGTVAAGVRYLAQRKLKATLRALEVKHSLQQERIRISRDLHDNVGSQLTYAIIKMDEKAKRNQDNEQHELAAVVRNTMNQLRETIWALKKENVRAEELSLRIMQYCRDHFKEEDVLCNYEPMIIVPDLQLSPARSLNLFRIVQEAIQNIQKHSRANQVRIRLEVNRTYIQLDIEDNGIGFDPSKLNEGHYGLQHISERAREIGAALEWKIPSGGGTILSLSLAL